MSSPARIYSIEALQDFRAALGEFAQKVSSALESAEMEIQRTLQWLKLDQQRYWKVQTRQRREAYTQAMLISSSRSCPAFTEALKITSFFSPGPSEPRFHWIVLPLIAGSALPPE